MLTKPHAPTANRCARILTAVTAAMTEWDSGVPERVLHFMMVHGFARQIALAEGVDRNTLFTIELAAFMHDIGIKPALEKYGSDAGPLQEKEGVEPAQAILTELGIPKNVIRRVCFLIAHHHTYQNVAGIDWQILLEADYLVNATGRKDSRETIRNSEEHFFRTAEGRRLLETTYLK